MPEEKQYLVLSWAVIHQRPRTRLGGDPSIVEQPIRKSPIYLTSLLSHLLIDYLGGISNMYLLLTTAAYDISACTTTRLPFYSLGLFVGAIVHWC